MYLIFFFFTGKTTIPFKEVLIKSNNKHDFNLYYIIYKFVKLTLIKNQWVSFVRLKIIISIKFFRPIRRKKYKIYCIKTEAMILSRTV